MRYTVRENEKFASENIKNFETSVAIQNEFYSRGIYVDINKESTIKTVSKYYHLIEHGTLKNIPMVYGKNFEKTYHIYTNGHVNFIVTSMNDGSNCHAFIIHGNCTKIRKIA